MRKNNFSLLRACAQLHINSSYDESNEKQCEKKKKNPNPVYALSTGQGRLTIYPSVDRNAAT